MNFFFANPWGLLALIGIPAVLAIHLLRRKSRTVTASTLFLVTRALKSREGGRKVQMLRSSWPLILQLLAVISLAVMISQPRWIGTSSALKVVAVLDSSASMGAFREPALQALRRSLDSAETLAGSVDMRVISSNRALISSGRNAPAVMAGVEKSWEPVLTSHDFLPALRLARNLAGPTGLVVWVTDHLPGEGSLPDGVEWISCGSPMDNAAFLASAVEGKNFTVWLRNFSVAPAPVRWKSRRESTWNDLPPASEGTMEIRGTFSADGQPVELELIPDSLTLDNLLPIVQPVSKPLGIASSGGELIERILRIAGPVADGPADLTIGHYDPLSPSFPMTPAILLLKDPSGKTRKPLPGDVVPENHPLMESLDWRGLIVRDSFQVPGHPNDEVLLWLDTRPLIFLRNSTNGRQLVFNFDVESSTAPRLPAFALLLHRFLEEQRGTKTAYSAANVATGEKWNLPGLESAPSTPGFFTHNGPDGQMLFQGAAQFGDPRESDLRKASSGASDWKSAQAVQLQNAEGKSLDFWWLVIAGVLLMCNFWMTGVSARPASALVHHG